MQIKFFTFLILFCCLSFGQQKKWSLDDCIGKAKEMNSYLLSKKVQNESLENDIKSAKGAFLPDASFFGSQGFNLGSSFDISTGIGQQESRYNSFSLNSSVTLFDGFANVYNLQNSKLKLQKGIYDFKKMENDLTLNIINKYLEVLFNKELVKVLEEQLNILEKQFERTKQLYDSALVSKLELLEIEYVMESDIREIVISKDGLKKSFVELKGLLGVDGSGQIDIEDISATDLNDNSIFFKFENDLQRALGVNFLIKSAEIGVSISEKEYQISKAAYFPKIDFNYSYTSNYYHIQGEEDVIFNPVTDQLINNGFFTQLNNNKTHILAFSLTVPIFNRFQTKSNIQQAKKNIEVANLELRNKKELLKSKLLLVYNDLKKAKFVLESTSKASLIQDSIFLMSRKKIDNGLSDFEDFLENKRKLIESKSLYIKAKYDYILKLKILDYYIN